MKNFLFFLKSRTFNLHFSHLRTKRFFSFTKCVTCMTMNNHNTGKEFAFANASLFLEAF